MLLFVEGNQIIYIITCTFVGCTYLWFLNMCLLVFCVTNILVSNFHLMYFVTKEMSHITAGGHSNNIVVHMRDKRVVFGG